MAAFLKDLQKGAKLKETTTKDRSAPMLKAGLDQEDIDKYHKDVFDTYVEAWEPLLSKQGLTFRTTYMTIDRATGEFLVKCYERFEKISEDGRFDAGVKRGAGGGGDGGGESEEKLLFEELFKEIMDDTLAQAYVSKLQDKMDECMRDFQCKKVFVKGSSRSAKDSVIYTQQFHQDFHQRCSNLGDDLDANSALIAMLGAGKDSMASSSATYFLRLFVRSERIYQDLTLAIENADAHGEFTQGFAIREWVDIDIGFEFRAFVHDNKLNAMCQYDYLILVNDLLDENRRSEISERLQHYWQSSVQPALCGDKEGRFGAYVVDFALDTTLKPWVIELNPFQESTDGAMFAWAQEGELLRNGPYEFRVQTTRQKAEVCLSSTWRALYRAKLTELQ